MNKPFSQRYSDVIQYSKEEADRLGNEAITPEHLLLGILRKGDGGAMQVLKSLHVDVNILKQQLEQTLKKQTSDLQVPFNQLDFDLLSSRIIKASLLEAKLLEATQTGTEHLLLAIMKERQCIAFKELDAMEVTYAKIKKKLTTLQEKPCAGFELEKDDDDEEELFNRSDINNHSQNSSAAHNASSTKENSFLDSMSTDITRAAKEMKLDPVVGREKEIERIAQILSRRKKNNPILIGEPGVGKSAIIEGLALRINEKKVPRALLNKRIVALDMISLVAGTKYRGEFEERVRKILDELKKNPDIILFIDEIHTIVGAGATSDSMDAANMLKPALARGAIQCIGATTIDEYRKHIEKDGALERRFQKVLVESTSAEETLQILRNIKNKYEDYHLVNYTEDALLACVNLADRYITDRNFPDKAIDVLDEAGSRVHLINIPVPKEIEEQEAKLQEVRKDKASAVRLQDFELAASFRDKERRLSDELIVMQRQWEDKMKEHRALVDEAQIADVVSMMSGVPVQRIAQTETVRLRNLPAELKAKVIAQDKAIETVVKAIRRSRIGLRNPNKPIGTFLFLGPTGVGKTHLAKELAKLLFGSADALVRIDMSEYMEKFNVSRLVGAPPGYVGYEEGGQLTEKVRHKPYSIVLLDEIEKAHHDVYNLLLQVMDEGRLTDSYGRTVDFRNTILIMTSNIGSRQLKEFSRGIGFTAQTSVHEKEFSQSILTKALNKSFAPEFINRLDEIVMFDQLDIPALRHIIDIELQALYPRIESLGYKLLITDSAKDFIANKGYDVEYGARPLRRAIQTYIEDELAEVILMEKYMPGDTIIAKTSPEGDKIIMEIKKDD